MFIFRWTIPLIKGTLRLSWIETECTKWLKWYLQPISQHLQQLLGNFSLAGQLQPWLANSMCLVWQQIYGWAIYVLVCLLRQSKSLDCDWSHSLWARPLRGRFAKLHFHSLHKKEQFQHVDAEKTLWLRIDQETGLLCSERCIRCRIFSYFNHSETQEVP